MAIGFPISRDPPEGGTCHDPDSIKQGTRFQFLVIPPKGERHFWVSLRTELNVFPVSRDPPEGGTSSTKWDFYSQERYSFQFLGIPPKGEL